MDSSFPTLRMKTQNTGSVRWSSKGGDAIANPGSHTSPDRQGTRMRGIMGRDIQIGSYKTPYTPTCTVGSCLLLGLFAPDQDMQASCGSRSSTMRVHPCHRSNSDPQHSCTQIKPSKNNLNARCEEDLLRGIGHELATF